MRPLEDLDSAGEVKKRRLEKTNSVFKNFSDDLNNNLHPQQDENLEYE